MWDKDLISKLNDLSFNENYTVEFFKNLLQNIKDVFLIYDSNFNLKYVSDSIESLSGYKKSEYQKKKLSEVLEEDSYQNIKNLLKEELSKTDNETRKIELKYKHKHKEYVWIESNFKLFRDSDGSPIGILCLSRDISKHKNQELNLKWLNNSALNFLKIESERDILRYIGKELNNKLSDAVVIVGKIKATEDIIEIISVDGIESKLYNSIKNNFNINPVNKTFKFVDTFKEIYKHQSIFEFEGDLTDFDQGNYPKPILRQLIKLFNIHKIYTIGLRRENELFAAIHIITRNKTKIEDLDTFETFFHQASIALQRKLLEEELVRAKLRAEESDNLKSAFLSNISHEIRTPMNGIMGFSNLLKKDDLQNDEKEIFINNIQSSSSRLLNIIDNLVDISKIQSNQVSLKYSNVFLNKFLEDIFDKYKDKALEKGLKLKLSLPNKSNDFSLKTDDEKLNIIFNNLIKNAIKYTQQGGVKFGYKIKNKNIEFFVEDSGIGIPKEKQKDIFNNFYQVDSSLSSGYEGAGLGLPISVAYISLLGGKYNIISDEGKGVKFYFSLNVS